MKPNGLRTMVLVAVVALAGCAGGTVAPGGGSTPEAGEPTPAPGGGTSTAAGTVDFYVSDERNAIDDFAHLNVTITRIGFRRADGDDAREPTATAAANATATVATTAEAGNGEDDGDRGGWVTYDVDGRAVDLTELRGANATRIANVSVPNGEYTKVFVYVDGIDATLASGERVRVKLPSERLHVNEGFAVGPNGSVDFVFDVSVHEAGESGKYILKPIVGQSGTDVPIEDIDDRDDDRGVKRNEGRERGGEDEAENAGLRDDETELRASFVGPVRPGDEATVEVTRGGEPVANATVAVNGEVVGATGSDGQLAFAVPDAEEVEVEVTSGDAEAELERAFRRGKGGG